MTRRAEDAGWLEEGTAEEALARFNLPIERALARQERKQPEAKRVVRIEDRRVGEPPRAADGDGQ